MFHFTAFQFEFLERMSFQTLWRFTSACLFCQGLFLIHRITSQSCRQYRWENFMLWTSFTFTDICGCIYIFYLKQLALSNLVKRSMKSDIVSPNPQCVPTGNQPLYPSMPLSLRLTEFSQKHPHSTDQTSQASGRLIYMTAGASVACCMSLDWRELINRLPSHSITKPAFPQSLQIYTALS